jgi:hypothetical protein
MVVDMAPDSRHDTSLDEYDYLPATVEAHERHPDALELVTISEDEDANIIVFDDDTSPCRKGELA